KTKKTKKRGRGWLGWVLKAVFIIFIVLFIAGYWTYRHYKKQLPNISTVSDYKPSRGTKLYSYDGQLIAEFDLNNRRTILPYDKIPENLKNAFVASEDKFFFSHWGINPIATLKAAVGHFIMGGRMRGASTISQQLCKPFVGYEKTFARKIKEAIFSVEFLERNLTKKQILYLYLNHIYLGSNAYGVQTAARTYFSKNVWELSLSEMALLAGLVPAPSRYSPLKHKEKALSRRNYVLNRMLQDEYITEEEYEKAIEEEIILNPQKELFTDKAPYFSEKVRRYLLKKYGYDNLYKKGMTVFTTVDMRATRLAHESVFKGLRELSRRQGYRRNKEQSHLITEDNKIETTNPLYSINIEKELETYLERHEKEFGKITAENISRGVFYQGVVLSVEKDKAEVQVGQVKRPVHLSDIRWANSYDPSASWRSVSSVKNVFDPGDVILVRATDKPGPKDPEDHRKTGVSLPEDFYFVLEQMPASQAAFIAKDPYSGYIKAIMGGYDFEMSEFDRTTQACRQPGSAIKPIFYSLAYNKPENGDPLMTPATLLLDAPVAVADTSFKPTNYERKFEGEITSWRALVHSMNTPAVRVLQKLGLSKAVKGAHSLGIKSKIRAEYGSVLGSSCLTLDELTDAYAHFPNNGMSPHTTYIRKIYDADDKLVENNTVFYDPFLSGLEKINRLIYFTQREEKKPLSKEGAYITTKNLEDVVNYGTGIRAAEINQRHNHHVAGKTGTTNEYLDAWFIGFNPNIVTGVWVGNDHHGITLGRSESGSKAALPIWKDFMERYLMTFTPDNYEKPSNVVQKKVDSRTGLLSDKGYIMYFINGTEPVKTEKDKDVLDPSDSFRGGF
ncbi:MAG: PBP1A family penicillin-binding protein, partial [bacterium]